MQWPNVPSFVTLAFGAEYYNGVIFIMEKVASRWLDTALRCNSVASVTKAVRGMSVTMANSRGRIPLDIALSRENPECLAVILRHLR